MNSNQEKSFGFLSGNVLKIIACISMAIDHVGVILFPKIMWFRIVGRIAFPVFAFLIAEGCKYTKNRLRYFLTIFIMGLTFQLVFYVVQKSFFMDIFITLSLSILIVYSLDNFKTSVIERKSPLKIALALTIFLSAVLIGFIICKFITVNYGFWGVMLPVFASVFNFRRKDNTAKQKIYEINFIPLNVLMLAVGLVLLSIKSVYLQWHCLLAIPLLLLYSGKRGTKKLKYFFYVFYPAHIVIIYAIAMLLTLF